MIRNVPYMEILNSGALDFETDVLFRNTKVKYLKNGTSFFCSNKKYSLIR